MRKLESVNDLLDAMRERNGWPSDYRIGKELGVPQPTISSWRTGVRTPDEKHAVVMARALDISPARVLAIVASQRSSDRGMRKLWLFVADQIEQAGLKTFVIATTGTLAMTGAYEPLPTAPGISPTVADIHYAKRRKRSKGEPAKA